MTGGAQGWQGPAHRQGLPVLSLKVPPASIRGLGSIMILQTINGRYLTESTQEFCRSCGTHKTDAVIIVIIITREQPPPGWLAVITAAAVLVRQQVVY